MFEFLKIASVPVDSNVKCICTGTRGVVLVFTRTVSINTLYQRGLAVAPACACAWPRAAVDLVRDLQRGKKRALVDTLVAVMVASRGVARSLSQPPVGPG